MSDQVLVRVRECAVDGMLSCALAHRIADELSVSPLEVGRIVNRNSDLRFYRCQLGLFGYGPKSEGKHRIVLPAENVPPEIEQALAERSDDGRISCLDIWRIADRFEYPRLGAANIVERLGLRVRTCQLRCF